MPSPCPNVFSLTLGQKVRLRCEPSGQCVISEAGCADFEVARDIQGFTLRDLDSPVGTFLNNIEVRGIARLKPRDVIRHGGCRLVVPEVVLARLVDGGDIPAGIRANAGLEIEVRRLVSSAALEEAPVGQQEAVSRPILNDISCVIRSSAFVGILGTSGSGKSTFVKALAGLVACKSGEIRLDGDIRTQAELLNERTIAYLPQDVILHEQLSPIEALTYLVRLKGLANESAEARQCAVEAIQRVSLNLADHSNRAIRNMSGGQRKRVALAAELLGDPQILLLDEATSGLDPSTEEKMMQLFASLSKEGKTVVCITHFPGRLHHCDAIMLLNAGRIIFDGPPTELMEFFQVKAIEDVFGRQEEDAAHVWEERFRQYRRDKPCQRSTGGDRLGQRARPVKPSGRIGVGTPSLGQQFVLLSSRYCRLQAADMHNLLLVCLQAPVIGLMIGLTYGTITVDFAELHAANTKEVGFLLVVAVLWCSGTASVREIVKEQAVVKHEARYGIHVAPYLLSKSAVLGLISLLQTTLLLGVVKGMTGLPGAGFGQWLVLALCGVAGVAVGLAVSAISGKGERAMSILPVILICQSVLSGGLAKLSGGCEIVARLANPAWWAFDGLRSTMSTALLHATYPGAPGYYQPPILGAGGPLALDVTVLLIQTVVVSCFTAVLVERRLTGGLR